MEIRYNSFVMYQSWIAAIRKMPIDDTAKLEALLAICDYGFTGEYVDNFAVDMVKAQIDKNITRKENGKKGGRPYNQTETKPKPNVNDNVNDNDNDNLNLNDNLNVRERFVRKKAAEPPRPTIDEVREYIKEKNYTFDPEVFFNHYESNGWMVGKNKMKNWKAACATWQRKETEFNNNKNNNHGRYKNNNDGFSGTGYTGDTI